MATRRHLETDETVAPLPMIRLLVQVQLTFSKKKKLSMRTNGTVPEPRTKTKGQHHRQRENMSLPLLHRSFINTGSCAKASASSLDVTSFATDCATMKKTHKRTEGQNQDVSEDRAIVTKRESTRQPHPNHNSPPKNTDAYTCVENDTQQPRSSNTTNTCFADNVLRPLTKLKADAVGSVQTACHDIFRRLF